MFAQNQNLTAAAIRPHAIPALTGLRLIGALWVVVFHFQPTLYLAWPQLRFFQPLFERGDFGVPLFFVLSGFIIWHNYGTAALLNSRATARFLWRRFARLWPVNLASALLVIPVVWWGVVIQNNFGAPKPEWFTKIGWIKSAFMVEQISQPDLVFAWNQPSWSLTPEMVAYVAFPALLLLLLATGVVRSRHGWVWAILAFVIAYLVENKQWLFPHRWMVELFLMFTAGVLLRVAAGARHRLPKLAAVVQVAAPAAIVAACYSGFGAIIVVLLGAWVWSLSAPTGPGIWFFTLRGMQIGGQASYSLYMLHWVLFGYGYILMHEIPAIERTFLKPMVVAMLALVALASWACWRWYETPARKLMNEAFERVWRGAAPLSAAVSDEKR